MEKKPLPSHLKYAYLGVESTLPVIISSSLTAMEEEKLLMVLQDHKQALGWSLADLKGIRPSVYASDFIRRWPQALSGSAEEVESDNEGGSSETISKMARY